MPVKWYAAAYYTNYDTMNISGNHETDYDGAKRQADAYKNIYITSQVVESVNYGKTWSKIE
jgi:hypothetical protein